jgi:hypothetical protein
MHDDKGLSSTHEMYLKVLYGLESQREDARVRWDEKSHDE